MTYDVAHKLLTIHGTLGTSLETWQFGLRFTDGATFVPPTQAMANSAWTAASAWFSAASTSFGLFPSAHHLTSVKLAHIQTNGKYPDNFSPFIGTGTAVAGGFTSGTLLPWQTAEVVTLTTLLARGRASRGRVYLPPIGVVPQTNGLMTTTTTQSLADGMKSLINSLNAISGLGVCSVMSNVGTGTHQVVQAVEAGTAYDTQRRRRRQLSDARNHVAL